jgi:hypothetical protein
MSVVQAVHDPIRAGAEKRRPLSDERDDVKNFFPAFTHRKHLMGRIAMKKNGLHQHRQVPVYQKENKDNHKRNYSVALTGKPGKFQTKQTQFAVATR